MMARSTNRSNQRPDTLMQDRRADRSMKTSCDARPDHTFGSDRPLRRLVADARFAFVGRKSRGTKARRGRAFPRFSRTPDMFRQAIALMIIPRYSSRLDGRSKHDAINLGASQLRGLTRAAFRPSTRV